MQQELLQHYLFQRLTPEQLQRVMQQAHRIVLREGELLFHQGDEANRFYLVVSGKMKLMRLAPDGSEKIIEIVKAGHLFAEALMFLNKPRYPVGASALEDTALISLDSQGFVAILRESIDLCLAMLGDMSLRLRALIREIDDITLHSATCRVAAFLLQQAPPDQEQFELDVPKYVIASRLSVKPETFSRIIKNLKKQGIVSVKGGQVTILDRLALRKTANLCAMPPDRY